MAKESCHEFVPGHNSCPAFVRSIIKNRCQKIDTTRRLQSKNYYCL